MKNEKGRFDEIVNERIKSDDFGVPQELTQREKLVAIICLIIMACVILFLVATTYQESN